MKIHGFSTGRVQVRRTFLEGKPAYGNTWQFLNANWRDKRWEEPLPILCWVIETANDLILVDTGDRGAPGERGILRTRVFIENEEEAGPQLRKLGYSPADLTKIVFTHLHPDHVGGLAHFPKTPVWTSRAEWAPVARFPGSLMRTFAAPVPAGFHPNLIDFGAEPYGAFDRSFPLTPDGSVIAVPTPGHSPGHTSIIAREGKGDVFIAGDITYSSADLQARKLQGPVDNATALRDTIETVLRQLELVPTVYLPSHDPQSLERLAKRQVQTPESAVQLVS